MRLSNRTELSEFNTHIYTQFQHNKTKSSQREEAFLCCSSRQKRQAKPNSKLTSMTDAQTPIQKKKLHSTPPYLNIKQLTLKKETPFSRNLDFCCSLQGRTSSLYFLPFNSCHYVNRPCINISCQIKPDSNKRRSRKSRKAS